MSYGNQIHTQSHFFLLYFAIFSRQIYLILNSTFPKNNGEKAKNRNSKGWFTHSMPFPCRAHAVPLPCQAAKGLEYVFPVWFTQCGRVWFTLAMPRPCHPRPCHSSPGHGTAWPSREGLWANCQRFASSGYQVEFHEVVIRRIPISDAGGQCETEHRLSWTRKRVVVAHYKKDDLLHCWTSSSDISGYHADIHEGHWHCRSRAGARHGNGMLCVNRPLRFLVAMVDSPLPPSPPLLLVKVLHVFTYW